MTKTLKLNSLNELGLFEFQDRAKLFFSLRYSKPFWGSCLLTGQLEEEATRLRVNETSLAVEDLLLKRGTEAQLSRAAVEFLEQARCHHRESFDTSMRRRP